MTIIITWDQILQSQGPWKINSQRDAKLFLFGAVQQSDSPGKLQKGEVIYAWNFAGLNKKPSEPPQKAIRSLHTRIAPIP